jgi:hypothetical protein
MKKNISAYLKFLSSKETAFLFLILPLSFLSAQTHEFKFELFTVKQSDTNISVISNGSETFNKEFENPFVYLSDLDQDSNDELLIKDRINSNGNSEYLLYICNTLDTFYLSDEINSGRKEPYEIVSGETDGLIIITGNPDFNFYNKNNEIHFIPVNAWKFEEGEVYSVNDLIYEPYIEENNNILSFIENTFSEKANDCNTSGEIKAALAAGYINYINAGESALASTFMETYYLCPDRKAFINELDSILNKE